MMEQEYDDWIQAGQIAAKVREEARAWVRENALIRETADKVEARILELGGKIAFPAQFSSDNVAAHYCPDAQDETRFARNIVKMDIGVHVSGAVADTAVTIDLTKEHSSLVKASEEALKAASELVRPGATPAQIGRAIHEVITSYGFSPIKNLSGHGLGRYEVHTSPSIPNYDTGDDNPLKKGQTIAIEPFATNGLGMIKQSSNATVFMLTNPKPVRDITSRKILEKIKGYEGLPFASRWLAGFGAQRVRLSLSQFVKLGIIEQYPPLVEQGNGLVSQTEHTFIVDEPAIITTRL